jgi:glycosyltransferase involved in cell wall biosynthesis
METHLQSLVTRLQSTIDLQVAVAADPAAPGHETNNGVPLRRMRTYGVIAATPICPELFSVIGDVNPDLVHIHHPHPLAMLAYLMARPSMPCVVSYHSDIVRQRMLRRVIAPIVHWTLARSAAILVASPQLIESPVLRPFRHKCHLVPYGLDTAEWKTVDPAPAMALREQYGRRIVLAVGRLTHYKGFEYLIRAMHNVVDATLVIVGEGALRQSLESVIAAEGLGDRVRLLGAVADVRSYYDACDVFVLPSISPNEAFGIVQLEAMAAGKPVVNTALDSGVTFACPTDVAALTVPPRDSAALAGAISRLLADPELRARLGNAGRARVAKEFPADVMADRTLEIYRAVTAMSTAGGHVRPVVTPERSPALVGDEGRAEP